VELMISSAKYIEGLENRLARMESLMRLSGVLPEDDDGSTDLATLERRLEARAGRSATPRNSGEDRRASTLSRTANSTTHGTPVQPNLPSPRSGTASPEPEQQTAKVGKEDDALAEMMCSLVTNNCGETRYIGTPRDKLCFSSINTARLFVRLLHLFTQRYPVGKREDGRQLLPRHDFHSGC
jgi:hypothetical protein